MGGYGFPIVLGTVQTGGGVLTTGGVGAAWLRQRKGNDTKPDTEIEDDPDKREDENAGGSRGKHAEDGDGNEGEKSKL